MTSYLLFVWKPSGYELRERRASLRPSARRSSRTSKSCVSPRSRRRHSRATRGPACIYRPPRAHQPRPRYGRRRARPPARSRSRRSRSRRRPHRRRRGPRRRDARACSSMRSPPIVCVMPGLTRTATRVPRGAGNGSARRLDLASPRRRLSATRPSRRALECLVVEHVPRARAGLSRGRLDEVVLRPRDLALEELLAAVVEDAREPSVELGQRDELLLRVVGVGHVAAVELVHAGRQLRAAPERVDAARRPRSTDSRAAAATQLARCAPNQVGSPWKPPVARTAASIGRLAEPDIAGRPREHLGQARADRSACRPCADCRSRAARPVRRATRATRCASSSRSQTTRCSRSSPVGHSARKSSHSRKRQTTQLDRSIDPPGASPFS